MSLYNAPFERRWIICGIVCGLTAVIIYPMIILVDLPVSLAVLMAVSFGFLLALGSIGFGKILQLHQPSVGAQIGALANTIGGAIVGEMLLVQTAVNEHMRPLIAQAADGTTKVMYQEVWRSVDKVQLALDVTWDFFIGIGTILLAYAAFRHPRYGWWFAGPGIALGAGLIVLNFWTFPVPPASADLVDLGPFTGLWYLAVTIRSAMSLRWVDQRLEERAGYLSAK